MIFFRPEKSIGDEEVRNLRLAIIENVGTPLGMDAPPGIGMLVKAGAVETAQAKIILWKMSRNPVQNQAFRTVSPARNNR